MQLKTTFLSIIFSLLCVALFAQDRIYKKNGEVVEAKILQITPEMITFKRFEMPDGPEYTIPKTDVLKIKYANGTQDIFEENNDLIGLDKKGEQPGLKHIDSKNMPGAYNIISFAPLQATENGWGFSLTYDRCLDKRGWVVLSIPAILTYGSSQNNSGGSTNNYVNPMFYLDPGVRIYTNLNTSKKAKFYINPCLAVASGNSTSYADYWTGTSTTTHSRSMLGMIVNFGWSLNPTQHLYIGLDFGFGYTWANNLDGQSQERTGLSQVSVKIGYKFSKKVNIVKY